MPNINISESDKSNFSDQQFIQIAYNGKTNIKSTPLTYRVTFTVDGNPYYIVDIGENQKISAPSVAPTKEGYTFKNWLLNDEAFDFDNIIEESIKLIAEFEEAPAPSGAILVNKKQYTTVNIPDTNYNIYSFDSSDIDTNNFTIYQQLINSIGLGNINHIVYVGNETFENKKYTLISGTTAGYMGNGYLYNLSQVDTGEDWCYIVGASGMVLATRNAETIMFGLDFIQPPPPSGTVIFDDDVEFYNDVGDMEHPERDRPGYWIGGDPITVTDDTFTMGVVGFVDDDTDTESKTVTKNVKLTLSEDKASVNINIGGTDYGTHALGTTAYLDGEPVDMEEIGEAGARVIGNCSLFPSGSFDDTEENYFCCLIAEESSGEVDITCLTYDTNPTFSCESKPFETDMTVAFNIEGTEYTYTIIDVEDYNDGQKITLSGQYPWMVVGRTYTVNYYM